MHFRLTKVRYAVSGAASAKSPLHKKYQPPQIETVERALPGGVALSGAVREAHFPRQSHPAGQGPSARPSRMPTYSLSPAVICVAESAPSAAVAAAASGQTQSVKAG